MPFYWTKTALRALYGVTADEVDEVLNDDRPRLPWPMVAENGLRVLVLYGRTRKGKYVAVQTGDMPGRFDHRIIGARLMEPHEQAAYDHWEATR